MLSPVQCQNPAPVLLLSSSGGTNSFLIAGDRLGGREEGLGRSGCEQLAGWERQTSPTDLFSPLFDSEERQASVSIVRNMIKIQKMRLKSRIGTSVTKGQSKSMHMANRGTQKGGPLSQVMGRSPSEKLSTCQRQADADGGAVGWPQVALSGPSSRASETPSCFHKTVSQENCYLRALCNFPIRITGCV